MATSEKTVTVAGYFKDKQVTKKEFIAIWTEHVNEFKRLDYAPLWLQTVQDFEHTVRAKAAKEFEDLYAKQTSKAAFDKALVVGKNS